MRLCHWCAVEWGCNQVATYTKQKVYVGYPASGGIPVAPTWPMKLWLLTSCREQRIGGLRPWHFLALHALSPVLCVWLRPLFLLFPAMLQMGLSTSTQPSLLLVKSTPMGSWFLKLLGIRRHFRKGKVRAHRAHVEVKLSCSSSFMACTRFLPLGHGGRPCTLHRPMESRLLPLKEYQEFSSQDSIA